MKYQLVLQFQASDLEDFGRLSEIEDRLIENLGEDHLVDGHDFGSGEMNIFIHTNDPKSAFEKARKCLSPHQEEFVAAYRELKGEQYTVLWPKKYGKEFRVI